MCFAPHGVHFFNLSTSKSALNVVRFVHFDLEMCFAPQRRTLFQPLNFQKCAERGTLCTFWLGNVLPATTAYTFSTSQLPKVRWTWYALYILTWKCASRHNGVHFFDSSTWKVVRNRQFLILLTWKCASRHNGVHLFDISTSKNGPYVSCFVHFDLDMCFAPHNGVHFFNLSTSKSALNVVRFVHFDLEMCFAPQRRTLFQPLNFQKCAERGTLYTFWLGNCFSPQWRTLFQPLNFQKCAERGTLCTFWLGNVLPATTAYTSSTSQLPKVRWTWYALYILTWKCASRHNGVQFFDISTSKSWSVRLVLCAFWLGNVLRATTAYTFSTS